MNLIRRLLASRKPEPPRSFPCCSMWRKQSEAAYYLHRVRCHGEGSA